MGYPFSAINHCLGGVGHSIDLIGLFDELFHNPLRFTRQRTAAVGDHGSDGDELIRLKNFCRLLRVGANRLIAPASSAGEAIEGDYSASKKAGKRHFNRAHQRIFWG